MLFWSKVHVHVKTYRHIVWFVKETSRNTQIALGFSCWYFSSLMAPKRNRVTYRPRDHQGSNPGSSLMKHHHRTLALLCDILMSLGCERLQQLSLCTKVKPDRSNIVDREKKRSTGCWSLIKSKDRYVSGLILHLTNNSHTHRGSEHTDGLYGSSLIHKHAIYAEY